MRRDWIRACSIDMRRYRLFVRRSGRITQRRYRRSSLADLCTVGRHPEPVKSGYRAGGSAVAREPEQIAGQDSRAVVQMRMTGDHPRQCDGVAVRHYAPEIEPRCIGEFLRRRRLPAAYPGECSLRIVQALRCVSRHHRLLFEPTLRSEEHTSELKSLMRISYAVFCSKKNTNQLNPHL